jgi:hypothetical protein
MCEIKLRGVIFYSQYFILLHLIVYTYVLNDMIFFISNKIKNNYFTINIFILLYLMMYVMPYYLKKFKCRDNIIHHVTIYTPLKIKSTIDH